MLDITTILYLGAQAANFWAQSNQSKNNYKITSRKMLTELEDSFNSLRKLSSNVASARGLEPTAMYQDINPAYNKAYTNYRISDLLDQKTNLGFFERMFGGRKRINRELSIWREKGEKWD